MSTSEARLNLDTGRPGMAFPASGGQARTYASRPSTVLVHAGASSDGEALVRQAAEVANLFGAKLIGVSTPPTHAPLRLSATEEDATCLILENAADRFESWSASVRAGASWTASDGPPEAALAKLAWAADLIMITSGSAAFVKSLVVRSRRPVLVRGRRACGARFRQVLVRWDGSAAFRRALACALPFLARADSVYIAPDRGAHAPGLRRALPSLQEGLALRGIKVRTLPERDRMRGPAPENMVGEDVADLVVMSAWPHPKWPFLAHSTDLRLREMRSCVLLSH